jgi:hypothetical protein
MSKLQSSEGVVHFILIARRLKLLLSDYEKIFTQWGVAVDESAEDTIEDKCDYIAAREKSLPVLERIVAVYELYRDNQYAQELKEEFWQSRECLQNEISSFFENVKDLNDVCDLAFMLHKENQHA